MRRKERLWAHAKDAYDSLKNSSNPSTRPSN
jgi:hypothetical protein